MEGIAVSRLQFCLLERSLRRLVSSISYAACSEQYEYIRIKLHKA